MAQPVEVLRSARGFLHAARVNKDIMDAPCAQVMRDEATDRYVRAVDALIPLLADLSDAGLLDGFNAYLEARAWGRTQ